MVIIGVLAGVVDICTGITPSQLQTMSEMYPDHVLMEQVGDENIGWTYDGIGFYPPASIANASTTKITRLAFLNRFTDSEAVQIDLASMGATVQAAMLRRELKRIDSASHIDLTDPSLANGLNMLETVGLMNAGRAVEILTTPASAGEVFTG